MANFIDHVMNAGIDSDKKHKGQKQEAIIKNSL